MNVLILVLFKLKKKAYYTAWLTNVNSKDIYSRFLVSGQDQPNGPTALTDEQQLVDCCHQYQWADYSRWRIGDSWQCGDFNCQCWQGAARLQDLLDH